MKLACVVLFSSLILSCAEPAPMPKYSAIKRETANACSKTNSSLQLRNALPIPDSQEAAAVRWDRYSDDGTATSCSGSFIGPDTLLTAAHCVYHSYPNIRTPRRADQLKFKGITPRKVIVPPTYAPVATGDMEEIIRHDDLAILIFPANTWSEAYSILNRDPVVNEEIIQVGYGPSSLSGMDYQKRMGKNRISSFTSMGMLKIEEANGTIGAPGDSGGTVLINGKVIGAITGGDEQSGLITNLRAPASLEFLRTAVARDGAVICGLDGHVCSGSLPDNSGSTGQPNTPSTTDSSNNCEN